MIRYLTTKPTTSKIANDKSLSRFEKLERT